MQHHEKVSRYWPQHPARQFLLPSEYAMDFASIPSGTLVALKVWNHGPHHKRRRRKGGAK